MQSVLLPAFAECLPWLGFPDFHPHPCSQSLTVPPPSILGLSMSFIPESHGIWRIMSPRIVPGDPRSGWYSVGGLGEGSG